MAGLQSKTKVVIMYANSYSMPREDGTILEGLTVEYYFFGDHGEAIKPTFDADSGVSGIRRSKCSLDISQKDKISYVPGVYDADFGMRVDKDGKPSLVLESIDFAGKCIMSLESDQAQDQAAATADQTDQAQDQAAATADQTDQAHDLAAATADQTDQLAQDQPKKNKK